MSHQLDALEARLVNLERLCDTSDSKPLISTIAKLEADVDSLLSRAPAIASLAHKLTDLGLWSQVTLDPTVGCSNDDLDSQAKAQVILSKQKQLEQSIPLIEQVCRMSVPETDWPHVDAVLEGLADAETAVDEVVSQSEELSIRSSQAVKVHLEGVVDYNENWVSVEKRIRDCERRLRVASPQTSD